MEENQQNQQTKSKKMMFSGIICLTIIIALFGGIGCVMGVAPMLNTIMHTAQHLFLSYGYLCSHGCFRKTYGRVWGS